MLLCRLLMLHNALNKLNFEKYSVKLHSGQINSIPIRWMSSCLNDLEIAEGSDLALYWPRVCSIRKWLCKLTFPPMSINILPILFINGPLKLPITENWIAFFLSMSQRTMSGKQEVIFAKINAPPRPSDFLCSTSNLFTQSAAKYVFSLPRPFRWPGGNNAC